MERKEAKTVFPCGECSKKFDFEDKTPFKDQDLLGCTQRKANVDPQTVKSRAELFKKVRNDKGG